MFNKNSFLLGSFLGLVLPIVVYAFSLFLSTKAAYQSLDNPTLHVIAITCNVFVFRFYMIRKKMMQTGKGILFVTLIHAFYYFYNNI